MITIGLTYYDNRLMLDRVMEYYTSMQNEHVKFMIADDASPNSPLKADDMPEDWALLRILDDVGWNNEGAKNLIMKQAETEWVILCDLDHVLMPHVYRGAHLIEKTKAN